MLSFERRCKITAFFANSSTNPMAMSTDFTDLECFNINSLEKRAFFCTFAHETIV